jgi:hypothetical protein
MHILANLHSQETCDNVASPRVTFLPALCKKLSQKYNMYSVVLNLYWTTLIAPPNLPHISSSCFADHTSRIKIPTSHPAHVELSWPTLQILLSDLIFFFRLPLALLYISFYWQKYGMNSVDVESFLTSLFMSSGKAVFLNGIIRSQF